MSNEKKSSLLLFILVFSLLGISSTDTYGQDTVWVSSVNPVPPETTVTVDVRLKLTHNIDALMIPLQFKNDDNLDIQCDSIHWSDWFYEYEATGYVGKDTTPYINNENTYDPVYSLPPKSIRIWALWMPNYPLLEPGDSTLFTLYFTTGEYWKDDVSVEIDTYVTTYPTNELELALEGIPYYPEFFSGFLGPGFAPECGDLNADYSVGISDIVYFINYLLKSGSPPQCPPEPYTSCADVNGDGSVDISDIVYFINYLLKSGPELIC